VGEGEVRIAGDGRAEVPERAVKAQLRALVSTEFSAR